LLPFDAHNRCLPLATPLSLLPPIIYTTCTHLRLPWTGMVSRNGTQVRTTALMNGDSATLAYIILSLLLACYYHVLRCASSGRQHRTRRTSRSTIARHLSATHYLYGNARSVLFIRATRSRGKLCTRRTRVTWTGAAYAAVSHLERRRRAVAPARNALPIRRAQAWACAGRSLRILPTNLSPSSPRGPVVCCR